MYLAYRELAEHFEASEQEPPAIEYYRKCLEIARDANHRGLQIEVGKPALKPQAVALLRSQPYSLRLIKYDIDPAYVKRNLSGA